MDIDKINQQYISWRTKASDCLFTLCDKSADEVWQGDWHFDWSQSWLIGCTPYEAARDAYAEMRDRGLLATETSVCDPTDYISVEACRANNI